MIWRALHLATAVAAAALAAAGAAFLFEWNASTVDRSAPVAVMYLGFLVALAHAVALGLPAYFLLRHRNDRLVVAIVLGASIGATPWALFVALTPSVGGFDSWSSGVQTVKDGMRTTAGWIQHGKILLTLAGFGALGGATFWTSLRISGHAVRSADFDASSHLPESTSGRWRRRSWPAIVFAGTAAVLAIPAAIEDRTCHIPFRHGANAVAPVLNIDLDAESDEWPALKAVLESASAKYGLSFRDSSRQPSETMITLSLSGCSDSGINVEVHELRFARHGFKNFMQTRGTGLVIYALLPGAEWRPVARDLLDRLEKQWPGRVRFLGPEGREVERPPGL
jgi:hypothetical protein